MKYKLITAFMAVILPVMALASYASYTYLQRSYLAFTEKELKNSADALVEMIRTAASVSIKNYLRAVAEENRDVIRSYYDDYRAGRIDKKQLLAMAGRLFASQTIGRTGYIYCINSHGLAVLHPNKSIQGKSFLQFDFIRQQIRKKTGYLEYEWKNPEDDHPRPKAIYMVYFKPLDWIISVSAYREEFKSLIHLSDIQESVSALRLGDSDYAFVTDRSGNLLIHPQKNRVKNIAALIENGGAVFKSIVGKKSGRIRYEYRDPATGKLRPKLAYFRYIDDYGWYVGTAYSEAEILKPLANLRSIAIISLLIMLAMSIGVSVWFSSYANTHIRRLIEAFGQAASGYFKVRLRTTARDEFGRLSHYFNTFMERLESYQRSLLEEIEKRKKMQNAVYESEKRLKSLVQHAPVLLWAIDRDGILTFYEGTLPVQFDSCECMITGRPLKELWGQWEEMAAHIDRALAGSRGAHLIKHPEYAIEIHYNPLFDIDREVSGAVGVAIDVTSRWQVERKLTESEQERQKMVMAIEQAAEIILITDTSGKIEYVNPAFEKFSGYSKKEAIGQNPRILKSDRHDQRFYRDMWRTISAGETWAGRIINRNKEGALFYEDATISPLRDENGEIVNYVASKRDVTQEVILEDQLQHAERMKAIGTLAGGIAHDFNNILSAIMGFTEICLSEVPDDDRMAHRLGRVMQAGQRARDLIDQILTFSRQEKIDPKPINITIIAKEVVKFIRASTPSTIALKTHIDKDTGPVMADPTRLHQVVMNLCTNAAHAMRAHGGVMDLSLSNCDVEDDGFTAPVKGLVPGAYVRLIVSDTGHGMDRETARKIFDPYFTTKGRGEGTGLGLSVVHGIVTKLGGAVTVYSEPDEGTAFHVYLPRIHTEEDALETAARPEVAGGSETVLLVDDEEGILEMTGEMLENLGYEVVSRTNGIEAFQAFAANPQRFDLVITDYTMPGMTGLELAEKITGLGCNTPTILCSGFSADISSRRADASGVRAVLKKPILKREMAESIRRILD